MAGSLYNTLYQQVALQYRLNKNGMIGLFASVDLSKPPWGPTSYVNTTFLIEGTGQAGGGGITILLPDARGSGVVYEFYVLTALTSGTYTITRNLGLVGTSDIFYGKAMVSRQDATGTVKGYAGAGATNSLAMDGAKAGGQVGDYLRFTDLFENVWAFWAMLSGVGGTTNPLGHAQ